MGTRLDVLQNMRTALDASLTDEMKTFLDKEISCAETRRARIRKPTAQQVKNEQVKTDLLTTLEESRLYSIGEILGEYPDIAKAVDMSANRLSAILHQMPEIAVSRVKGKSFYSL